MTRTERVSDLLAITARLIACMEQEIALLRRMRAQDIAPLQAHKGALADAYEAHIAALRDTGADEEPVSAALIQELTVATERLQAAIAENLRAVRAAREINDKVLKAIVAAVEDGRAKPTAYGRGGPAHAAWRALAPLSITVDGRC
ncbi:MAG: hypothetical protein IRY94_15110 [Rhodospirillaceae bacterium]|nr:hypothetical protein [Rhodospirillaceae bacterium]